MIMAGSQITAGNDPLHKVQEEYLFNSIRHSKPSIEAQIRRLRIIYNLDAKQYSLLKRSLPYVVCGIFSPPYRKKENFAYIEYFIVDIDHISEKGLSLEEIRLRIQKDERVVMCFSSPSEDGLKVMFRLEERCYEPGLYSIFYKAFIKDFSSRFHLEQVVDACTSDVSRACFISMDPQAYYNKDATKVSINAYLDLSDTTALFDLKREQDEQEKISSLQRSPIIHKADPDKDIMDQIKARLNPRLAKIQTERTYFVPDQLNQVIEGLKNHIEEEGILVKEIRNIQYGKKIRCSLGLKLAEINLFYGKKGFSVVKSPKTGTNEDFNELVRGIVHAYVNELMAP